jgi:hypothetical protein
MPAARPPRRKEWKALLYGQALNLVFNYAVPPHVAKFIILGAMQGLGHLFGLGGPMPFPHLLT